MKFLICYLSFVYLFMWMLFWWGFMVIQPQTGYISNLIETAKWPFRFWQMWRKVGMFKD